MPSTPKILAGADGSTTLGTSEADLLVPGGSASWTGIELVLYNSHSASVTVTLYARKSGASNSSIIDVVVVAPGARVVYRIPCVGASDKIRAKDSQGSVVYATAFGAENT